MRITIKNKLSTRNLTQKKRDPISPSFFRYLDLDIQKLNIKITFL